MKKQKFTKEDKEYLLLFMLELLGFILIIVYATSINPIKCN